MSEPASELLELEVGPVAHGGHCVARHEGRVIFVRHALPGERVRARLTDAGEGASYWRADAVEVLTASPDRVEPPCPHAGPGLCGGCDWQHASLPAQRRLKAAVVTEQLSRLGKLTDEELLAVLGDGGPDVEAVPGDDEGLGWRTRVRFAVGRDGRPGLHPHRSHAVIPVGSCPIADPAVDEVGAARARWPRAEAVEVVVPSGADAPLVVAEPARVRPPALGANASVAVREGPRAPELTRVRGRTWLRETVLVDGEPRDFRVTGAGFWQVHPGAAQALLDAVLAAADPRPGERAVDLYAGVGLFAAGLAARVGGTGSVVAVESDTRAAADARRSLHDLPQVAFRPGRVERVLPGLDPADVVVLDPPRAGAGKKVVEGVAALGPRVVVYVACDPAALARDVATFAAHDYRLTALRSFDAFPMTHHVECVATLALIS